MTKIRTMLALGCAAAVTVPLMAVPAVARPQERFRDAFTDTFEFECGDTTVEAEIAVTANIVFVARGRSGLPHWQAAIQERGVYTNTDTDRTYSYASNYADRDFRVTDNGDGTLSIVVQLAGSTRYFDAEGKLLYIDSGTEQLALQVDHNGTPDDPFDDGEADFLGVIRELTGRTDTSGRDFCTDLLEITG
ncbi:hypothetical protein [Ornithinimicrobium cerasi]|uniref:Uncharacterized protein n=1 Tax=Ornithinimicrobium cerasi TaxID=2248773 RepID=A0A285VI64_9MICO|nr:hypothetical protein [Ornithinimicrobium cerasi]SOC53765.1 hypothetical protein SAMN05421879_102123 [Ornithinimicrobium cerasi]